MSEYSNLFLIMGWVCLDCGGGVEVKARSKLHLSMNTLITYAGNIKKHIKKKYYIIVKILFTVFKNQN